MTAAAGYSGTPLPQKLGCKDGQRVLVALIVVASAGTAESAIAQNPSTQPDGIASLIGCWRHYDEYTGKGDRITLPSGDIGLSWGVDPATGKEIVGMWPYSELCFDAGGIAGSMHFGIDEGLGSSGPYEFDGRTVTVRDAYAFPDGWLFRSEVAKCSVRIDGDSLSLESCSGAGTEPFSMSFVRSSS